MAAIVKADKKPTDMNLRELQSRKLKIWEGEMNDKKFRDLFRDAANGADIDKEQEKQFDEWNKEMREIETEMELRKRDEELEAYQAKPRTTAGDVVDAEEKYDPKFKPSESEVRSATTKLTKRGFNALNPKDKKVIALVEREDRAWMDALKVGFDPGSIDNETKAILDTKEQRAQTVTTTGGGYLIPEGFITDIVKFMKYISPFFEEYSASPTTEAQNLFNFRKTTSGNNIPWPTYDDTSNVGELLGINTSIGAATDMTFSRIVLLAYKYSSKPILIPYELFEDDGVGVSGLIAETMATRIGRILNTHLTTGDNSSKPQGIITGATSGKVSAATTAVTFPEILALVHSVDPSYRKRPTCRFMLHDNILLYLKQVTVGAATTNARPLWAPGYSVGAPDRIDGVQYVINQDMASAMTTGSKILLFGDMKAYAVRMVNDVRAYKMEERYRDADQTGFVSFLRMDGRTLNTNALKYLRLS